MELRVRFVQNGEGGRAKAWIVPSLNAHGDSLEVVKRELRRGCVFYSRAESGGDRANPENWIKGYLLCSSHSFELEIRLHHPYRFLNGDYSVFDCGSMAFSATSLKPLVRVLFQLA